MTDPIERIRAADRFLVDCDRILERWEVTATQLAFLATVRDAERGLGAEEQIRLVAAVLEADENGARAVIHRFEERGWIASDGARYVLTEAGHKAYVEREVKGEDRLALERISHVETGDLQIKDYRALHTRWHDTARYATRLAEKGYLKRERHPLDRRAHTLRLTPEGRKAVEEAEATLRRHVNTLERVPTP